MDVVSARGYGGTDIGRALADTRRAFDGVAAGYGRSNDENPLLCAMRDRAMRMLETLVPRGARVLDLGCGPGCDEERLAAAGYDVTAIDWSPAMVVEARRRLRQPSLGRRVRIRHLGIHQLERLAPSQFDCAYSNFGALNCVPDLEAAAGLIAARLRPGGVLIASVIGRCCPWEIAVYLSRGEWRRAFLRLSRGLVPVPLEGRTVWTRYVSPGQFERAFTPAGFERTALRALGCFVPPPYMQAFAARHAAFIRTCQRLDDRFGDLPGLRSCGDHFLIAMRRQ